MELCNIRVEGVDGNLVFSTDAGSVIATWDNANRKLSFPSGSTLESLGTTVIADATLSPNDLSLAQGSILVGDAAGKAVALSAKTDAQILVGDGTTVASVAVSGDVAITKTGAVTIQAKAVENTMIAAAAGTVLVGTKTSGDVTALDNSAAGAIVIGQGAGETCAAAALSGDVKMDKTGATTIQAKAVESSMIAAAAGTVLVGTKTSGDVTALDNSAEGAVVIGQGAGETCAAAALSGDVKMDKTGATTIQSGAVEAGMVSLAAGNIHVGTKTSNVASAVDMSAEGAVIIGQGAGETPAAAALSGDVKMDKTGATTIQAKAVENTMIAAAAGTVLVGTKTSGDVTALDISAEGAMALGQGAGETAAAYAMSGDVTMTKGGVTAIGAAKVTSAMLANGAGLAAIVTAGLGNSTTYVKTDDGTKTILADNATKDRGVLVVAVVDEVFADNGGGQTVIEIGEEATIDKGLDHTILANAAQGAVFCRGFVNSSGKDIIATVSKATGAGTGGASFAVLALPNS